jgi:hypothetical protein
MAIVEFNPSINSLGHRHRWMMFVDGENLAIRAQEVAATSGHKLKQSDRYILDVFFWFGLNPLNAFTSTQYPYIQQICARAYYYTSCQGDEDKRRRVHDSLWKLGFAPEVFTNQRRALKPRALTSRSPKTC